MYDRKAVRRQQRYLFALPPTRGLRAMLNLPGDVVTMLIVMPIFLLSPLLVIFIAYRIIR